MTAEKSEQAADNGAGFFQLAVSELSRLVAQGGGHNEMATYVVLCSGVNVRGALRYCTHGAKSVHGRTGISYRTARKAIDWLLETNFIRRPTSSDLSHLGTRLSRATKVECVILGPDERDVAVSRNFVEGQGKSAEQSPIGKLFENVAGTDGIPRAQAVLDVFLLYFGLMRDQDFGDCAGVDPDAWYRKFVPVDDLPGEKMPAIPGTTDSVLVTIEEASTSTNAPLLTDLLACAEAGEELTRVWHAVSELHGLKLIYPVLVMWDGDPLDPRTRRMSEPLATLYIADRWARDIDDHLQNEVHEACWRTGVRDRAEDFGAAGGPPLFVGSGRFRYIIRERDIRRITVVGQLRVRYWAATASTVAGRRREAQRTASWRQGLQRLRS